MKKLFTILTAVIFGAATLAVHAQTKQPAKSATTKSAKAKAIQKNRLKEDTASSEAAVATGPRKKDGTLPLKYKSNKGANKTIVKGKVHNQ